MSHADERLTAAQAAFRAGLKLGRWYAYVADGRAPQHDGVDYPTGETGVTRNGVRWWWRSTVDAWITRRRQPEPKVEEHGTIAGYSRHRYQREQPCEPCRAAWAERQRQRRNAQAEKGLPPRDPRHGTTYAYDAFNCRCVRCHRAAAQRYQASKTKEYLMPRTLNDLLAWLTAMPPLERARVAALLVDHDTTKAVGAVRREAIYELTRNRPYADVAVDLGVSPSAINKAVSEHRRTA